MSDHLEDLFRFKLCRNGFYYDWSIENMRIFQTVAYLEMQDDNSRMEIVM